LIGASDLTSLINQSFSFDITPKTKRRAKKRRMHNEKLFVILLRCSGLLLVAFLCVLCALLFCSFKDDLFIIKLILMDAIFLITSISVWAFADNLGSRWIDDRLNEKL